jgi:hypothetical protein
MPENVTPAPPLPGAAPEQSPASVADAAPTLADDFLHSACTLARGRTTWTPGPGYHTEDLPWLRGATAA